MRNKNEATTAYPLNVFQSPIYIAPPQSREESSTVCLKALDVSSQEKINISREVKKRGQSLAWLQSSPVQVPKETGNN